MKGSVSETVGPQFRTDLIRKVRDKTLRVVQNVAKRINLGMNILEIKESLRAELLETGSSNSWHPPQIRLGENTLLPFGKTGDDSYRLKETDIFL